MVSISFIPRPFQGTRPGQHEHVISSPGFSPGRLVALYMYTGFYCLGRPGYEARILAQAKHIATTR